MIHYGQAGYIPETQAWFNICKSLNIIGDKDGLGDRNSMIISIDTETSVKIQHLFIIKGLTEPGLGRTHLKAAKALCDKSVSNSISTQVSNDPRVSLSPLLASIVLELLARVIRPHFLSP